MAAAGEAAAAVPGAVLSAQHWCRRYFRRRRTPKAQAR